METRGCGDVALRCLALSSSCTGSKLKPPLLPFMVFNRSNVACLLVSNDAAGSLSLLPLSFSTSLNIMLYRSILVSGISTSRSELVGIAGTARPWFSFDWR